MVSMIDLPYTRRHTDNEARKERVGKQAKQATRKHKRRKVLGTRETEHRCCCRIATLVPFHSLAFDSTESHLALCNCVTVQLLQCGALLWCFCCGFGKARHRVFFSKRGSSVGIEWKGGRGDGGFLVVSKLCVKESGGDGDDGDPVWTE